MVTKRSTKLLVAATCLVGFALPATAGAAKSPISVGNNPKMYNERYCEYLFVHTAPDGAGVKLVGDVWNTFGLNKCPAAQWEASDKTALAALFPGLSASLVGTTVSQGVYFYLYALLRQLAVARRGVDARGAAEITVAQSLAVASLAGMGNVLLTNP